MATYNIMLNTDLTALILFNCRKYATFMPYNITELEFWNGIDTARRELKLQVAHLVQA